MYTNLKQNWFKKIFWIIFLALLISGFMGASIRTSVLAQDPTPGSSDVLITVTYTEQINIRNGPSTVLYDIIGHMQPGETAKALGVSPGRDWVQIVFPAGPGGIGWVHTSLIAVSPLTTPTLDPTLAAAYVFEPTATRMPTFTAPPPLEIPKFTTVPAAATKSGWPMGALVVGSGVLGVLGYLLSLLRKR